ncbi:MAG: hypothetical protein JW828_16420 [Sedimentisphaerales bacterium]|nr:hypothetical protein [Sedimentisphaerales bacterium]
MLKHFKQLDGILRGDATRMANLTEGRIDFPIGGLISVLLILGLIYGACMGSFAMIRTGGEAFKQLFAGMVKFPLLFGLTLIVTFPSLYVFNALVGSRLSMDSVFRLLIASMGVILAVVASLGPIVVFFAVSTTSYPFMILLNVAMCSIGGVLGLAFLLRTLHRLVIMQESVRKELEFSAQDTPEKSISDKESGAAGKISLPAALDLIGDRTNRRAWTVFRIWIVVFALVGAQMSWVLRPFIGNPNMEFTWFRARESNFFLAVLQALASLVGLPTR